MLMRETAAATGPYVIPGRFGEGCPGWPCRRGGARTDRPGLLTTADDGCAAEAMEALAAAYPEEEVGKKAYHLYERFRPTVPQGKKGWGGKGELDLDLISNKMVQESSANG